MRMKNETNWQTKQLRGLVIEVAHRELLESSFRRRLFVRVKNKRGGGVAGSAFLHSHTITLKLPNEKKGPIDSVALAFVIAHELAHCQGTKHRDLDDSRYGWKKGWTEVWGWAKDYPIEAVPTKPKPNKAEVIAKEKHQCLKALARWERKAKMAQTYLKKYRRKIDLLGRKAAAITTKKEN